MTKRPKDPLHEAAPDLLAALKDLTSWWASWMPADARRQGGRDVLIRANAAILKAEGRTPKPRTLTEAKLRVARTLDTGEIILTESPTGKTLGLWKPCSSKEPGAMEVRGRHYVFVRKARASEIE